MNSITIHNLDPLIAEGIEQRARERGESLNSTIKGLIAQALGLSGTKAGSPQGESGYRRFLGFWSETEKREFDEAVEDFEKIDESDWRV